MTEPAILIRNLGKRYQLGSRATLDQTLSETISNKVKWAADRLRHPLRHTARRPSDQAVSNDFWALRDINLDINHGEVVGIIGRNGAGKSTLLKVLSQITDPTEGTAVVHGRVASLLEVGTGFHPELTGRENIYLNGSILGMTRREINAKFDEIVDFSGVERFLDTPIKRYSSGMTVRLAFSVAAHLEPEILIIDEVLAVGDAAFQKKCLGKMKNVAGSGRTVLFVTHNMAVVDSLCDRAVLIDEGRVHYEGDTHSTVRAYLENVLSSQISTSLSDRTDRSGDGSIRLVGFDVEDDQGHSITHIRSGDDLNFVLSFECSKDCARPLKNISAGVGFCSSMGQRLAILYTNYMGQDFETVPPKGQFRCRIPNFPFAPNRYEVHVRIVANGVDADWLRNPAAYIDVISGDYFGTGAMVDSQAPLLLSGQWSVNPSRDSTEATLSV